MQGKIDYQEVLNPSQLEAVTTLEGPVLVIAGAGSGKTRTLVYRVARLVETGVSPENILLLTFTRKAAGEMMERAASLADSRCRLISGGTFHSLAHSVLRTHGRLLGFENSFTVLDRSDMEEILQTLAKESQIGKGGVRFPKSATLATILSKGTNLQESVESLMREEFPQFLEYIPDVDRIGGLYTTYKKTNQLMDYDDLLVLLRRLLAENEDIRDLLGRRYRYIMVDEYQDTNGIQADIVKWLASNHQNVMVVGDDSQSIYSFRGANYRNMFEFPRIFENTKIVKLEQNYRSTQPILTLTNALMDQAVERFTKCLFTKRKGGEKPKVINVKTVNEQALFICRSIKEQVSKGRSLRDIAVLFRAAYHSFELELELARQEIPFVKFGGFKFMESAHRKDLISHLRVIVNRNDTVSWGRILRLVKNIGQRKSQSIIEWMKKEGKQPFQIGEWSGSGKGDAGVKALSDLMVRLSDKDLTPRQAVESANQYYDPVLKERFDDFPRRQKDLKQLADMAERYERLRDLLDDLALDPPSSSADVEPGRRDDYLTLSTVHSSKGLEWPVVYIIWLMEGYFPSSKARLNVPALEEERRLMYVAATRAKDELFMCYPGEEEPPIWQLAEAGYRRGLSSFIQALSPDVMFHESPRSTREMHGFRRASQSEEFFGDTGDPPPPMRPGDRVRHPAFGAGVVSRLVEGEKIEVLFRDAGRKLLHLQYTTLEKI